MSLARIKMHESRPEKPAVIALREIAQGWIEED